jgi:hypothetical protein
MFELPEGTERVAILHHWDTDGVCSAAIAACALTGGGYTGSFEFVCAPMGVYAVDEDVLERMRAAEPDLVYLVDYNVAAEDTEALAATVDAPVRVIDHHRPRSPRAGADRDSITVLNPVAGGAVETEYPATTWVLGSNAPMERAWMVHIGIVGDLGHRAEAWFEERAMLSGADYGCAELFEASQLIDALYKVNDRGAVEEAARWLKDADVSLDEVRSRSEWRELQHRADDEMRRIRAVAPCEVGPALLFNIDTRMNLTSAYTRKLAKTHDGPVVVINTAYYEGAEQIYARNIEPETSAAAIDLAVGRGYSAGGKDSVFAGIVPNEETPGFIEELVGLIENASDGRTRG